MPLVDLKQLKSFLLSELTDKISDFTLDGITEVTVTTTDATLTTIATIAIPDDTVVLVHAELVGRRTDAADRAAYIKEACIYREAAGAAVRQGPIQNNLNRDSDSIFDAQINVSGNNAIIQVLGAAGKTINWKCRYKTMSVA